MFRRTFTTQLAAALGLGSVTPAPTRPDALDTGTLVRALRAVEPDPAPPTLTNGKSYLVSNERRLDLFRDDVTRSHGILLAVGSDPAYFLAGWSRPRAIVIVDFDLQVVRLHQLHALLFANADTISTFETLWSDAGRVPVHALVTQAFPSEASTLLELYDLAQPKIARRLAIMRAKMTELACTSFLDTPAAYRHLHALARAGRILAVRGDFTVPGALRSIGDVLRTHAGVIPLRTLYLSNIEQYFMYGRDYRENMLHLPMTSSTVVLRTLPGRPAGFEYLVQSGDAFREWLAARGTTSVYRMRGIGKGEPLVAGRLHRLGSPR